MGEVHQIRMRTLTEEKKTNLQNELVNSGWEIVGHGGGVQSPELVSDEVNWLLVACPDSEKATYPSGYQVLNDKECIHCGLPVTVDFSKC